MAIKNLTEEQVRTWSLEQKDRWWLANVFRGDMPQLTIRSALTGFVLGGLLSATNLYVGAKTGWTLGVGLTSVILAFAMFKVFSKMGAKDFTILENNAMQSIATSAGYMTGPLISGMAAYMWVQNELLPWWQMLLFNVVLSVLGVLVAFPMKRRFINDEQQPFPEGRACGVVLDTLYTSDASVGMFQAKALAAAALIAGGLKFIAGESYMTLVQAKLLGQKTVYWMNEHLDAWFYKLVDSGRATAPKVLGTEIRHMGVSPMFDLAMIGAGGLMGIRPALNMFFGMALNFLVIVPLMIHYGEIKPRSPELLATMKAGTLPMDRVWALNTWALWWGIAIMVVAALTGLFAKPQLIISAFSGLFGKKRAEPQADTGMKKIELPLWISVVGIPIVGAVGVWMAHAWFGVDWYLGAAAIPLIIVLTLIAVNSTALTGITPTGSLSKIPQFLFGALRPKHPGTNLMTAVMCVEVASNASNLLMDIKPGYMLGAKPRQQAIGHTIGIGAGALASTPLFYVLFLSDFKEGGNVQAVMTSGQFGFPSALQWRGISDLIRDGFGSMAWSAQVSMAIAAAAGLILEIVRIVTKNKSPISPLAIGLGVVIPPDSTIAMLVGASFFWLMTKMFARPGAGDGGAGAEHGSVEGKIPAPSLSLGERLWVGGREPICAGLIAGAALVGIGDILVKVFVLK
jgi:uncharacterized oligopeptide transporter (OPT) family protein